MTATTMAPPATSVSTIVVLRRALAGEWHRIWTVRSTWWSLLAAMTIAVGMGATFGIDFEGEAIPVWAAGEYTITIAQLPLLVLAMLSVTGDYATGAIRSTLQWVPRRGVLLTARTTVALGIATAAGVAVALVADMTAWLWLRTDLVVVDVSSSLADVAVVVANGALLTIALATILRSAAGTLTTAFMLLIAFPVMLPESGVAWLATLGRYAPGMALTLLEGLGGPDTPGLALILTGWAVATTAAAGWLLARRDAA